MLGLRRSSNLKALYLCDIAEEIFSFRRTGANEIEISAVYGKKAVKYKCSEHCVVDSSVIVREWILPLQKELREES